MVGLNEISLANAFTIFPNPCKDYMMIEIPATYSYNSGYMYLYDCCGRKIFADKLNGTLKLSIKDFTNGLYFLQINIQNNMYLKKIIISN